MRHYSQDQWTSYIANETADDERTLYEAHLYSCDSCLALYVNAIEFSLRTEEEDAAPVTAPAVLGEKTASSAWYERPVFLYAAACAITLLLMTSGVFEKLTSQVDHFESHSSSQKSVSYSDQLMHKTVTMLDALQPKEKGGIRVEP